MEYPSLLTGAPEALTVRFASRPYDAMRRIRRTLGEEPRSARLIAKEAGVTIQRARQVLAQLAAAGLALGIGKDRFVSRGPVWEPQRDEDLPPEVGRQILSCLTEPRRAKDIAVMVSRPPSVTTGHLRHLLNRGLIVRVDKGVYALASRVRTCSAGRER